MKEHTTGPVRRPREGNLPVHSLEAGSAHILILPLDHDNPYDFRREHRHTYFELMLIGRGGGNQLVDFTRYPVRGNSCYLVAPQQVHLMNRGDSTGFVVQFTEERIPSPELRTALRHHSFREHAVVLFEERPEVMSELNVLLDLLRTHVLRDADGGRMAVTHLLQSLVSLVLLHRRQVDGPVMDEDRKLFLGFCQLVEECYSDNPGVRNLARTLGATEKKLSAATRRYAGLSPLQMIHNRVLLEAKRLLVFEAVSHKEIAFRLGFDSPASFSAFIRARTGYSPSGLCAHLAEIHT